MANPATQGPALPPILASDSTASPPDNLMPVLISCLELPVLPRRKSPGSGWLVQRQPLAGARRAARLSVLRGQPGAPLTGGGSAANAVRCRLSGQLARPGQASVPCLMPLARGIPGVRMPGQEHVPRRLAGPAGPPGRGKPRRHIRGAPRPSMALHQSGASAGTGRPAAGSGAGLANHECRWFLSCRGLEAPVRQPAVAVPPGSPRAPQFLVPDRVMAGDWAPGCVRAASRPHAVQWPAPAAVVGLARQRCGAFPSGSVLPDR
jgi:hypothetical protein